MGISRFGRDFQGSGGAGGNLLLVFTGFHAPAFSTALFWFRADPLCSLAVKAPYHVRAEADRDRLVQVFMDRDRTSGQCVTKPRFVDLPQPVSDRYRVVLGHHALGLHSEDPVQVRSARAPKCRAFRLRRYPELAVKLPDVLFPQKDIGALRGGDPCQAKFLRQAPLPGSETAFRPAPRLR